jgi:hypothetical protein
MKRSGAVKFPNSVQLFKFCQKVLSHQRGEKIRDQEVGEILEFNPSDCSHWKRGEKNVRSVFALAKLAEVMQIETTLVHDVASGAASLDEAYFDYLESRAFKETTAKIKALSASDVNAARVRVESFVKAILAQSDFTTPPLYLPEVMRFFSFVVTQPMDMIDKLSRILRVKPGQYTVHFRKGDLKPQTRMSIIKDLARIIFEGERARFPELGPINTDLVAFESTIFTADLLAPKAMIQAEIAKLDARRNVVAELATLFWVPKSLICLQLQEIVRTNDASRVASAQEFGQAVRNASANAPRKTETTL